MLRIIGINQAMLFGDTRFNNSLLVEDTEAGDTFNIPVSDDVVEYICEKVSHSGVTDDKDEAVDALDSLQGEELQAESVQVGSF